MYHEVLDHNCKKPDFVAFIKKLNAPVGSSLLMDNIAFHHSKETLEAINSKGYKPLFIPPYSPRLNAIENFFGILKSNYRKLCPPSFMANFNYKDCFENLTKKYCNYNLLNFFNKSQRIVDDTLLGIQSDPLGFSFCGYD